MSENPYESPRADNLTPHRKLPVWKLRKIVFFYRLSWVAILVNAALHAWQIYYELSTPYGGVHLGFMFAAMFVFFFTAAIVFPLAQLTSGLGAAVLSVICMILPLLSLAVLIIVNRKAIGFLRAKGIEVGTFGTIANRHDLK